MHNFPRSFLITTKNGRKSTSMTTSNISHVTFFLSIWASINFNQLTKIKTKHIHVV